MENPFPETPSVSHAATESQGAAETRNTYDAVSPDSRRPERESYLALLTGIGYLLFYRLSIALPFGNNLIVGLTTIVSLFILLLFTVRTARALRSRRALALNLTAAACIALPAVLIPLGVRLFPLWGIWKSIRPIFIQYWWVYHHAIPGLDGLTLVWLAAGIGTALSRLVREFKILLPMAVALALVDIYVVFGGGLVTSAESGRSPVAATAMRALTVQLPTAHPMRGAAPIQLTVGFADFLFIALFFASFARFQVPSRKTFAVLFTVLVGYGLVVFLKELSLPALVPIAVVVIGMNFRRFRYERSELFALLYAGLLIVAILGGIAFFSMKRIHSAH